MSETGTTEAAEGRSPTQGRCRHVDRAGRGQCVNEVMGDPATICEGGHRYEVGQPRFVLDGWGNHWRYYHDTGYVRLQVVPGSGATLEQIVEQTGAIYAVEIRDPVKALHEAVTRRG